MGAENRQYSAQAHKAGTPKVWGYPSASVSVLPPDHPVAEESRPVLLKVATTPSEAIK